ncbi:hypothetical protein M5K25_015575 [Dendrobium thyrsiflorum]|uniref:Coronatine-insensitive protein 1 n=1 Tax=Dendrobium thyrsiflorum TaxID=117978 RepID=A0ABD0UQY5_DENTH
MENRELKRVFSLGMWDLALECVMDYIDDPCDRAAISLVCKKWHRIDCLTRKQLTIAVCYSTTPQRLHNRFPGLESLKVKGKPRAAMFFNLIPEDWGGYAGPWINEVALNLTCLKSLHLRRMIVKDADLDVLVRARSHILQSLMLDKCSGFSTDGLLLIASSCRSLRTLFLDESSIIEKDGDWLHHLAMNNSALETLSFYNTELQVSWKDLVLIAKNCQSLVSLKISECDLSNLVGVLDMATGLEEFGGGSFDGEAGEDNKYSKISFPRKLCSLGLNFLGMNEMHIIFPVAAALKKLDLQYTFLSTEDHCQLIQRCPNLEVLEVRDVIGDKGLEVVGKTCRKMRRLRIERGEDELGLEDEHGKVSHIGLLAVAQGCLELEYLAVYVSDINNSALESFGTNSKNLRDFRLVLLEREQQITELPLDNGILALLRGCTKLKRFSVYLRPGGLTDVGLGYLGQYSNNIKWMLLGHVGESDEGLLRFARGCPKVQKLELRGCCFSERALALAVLQLPSLRYIWVHGYIMSSNGHDLMIMDRPFWNIELIPRRQEVVEHNGDRVTVHPAQILAYYSIAGRRTDYPSSIVPLRQ